MARDPIGTVRTSEFDSSDEEDFGEVEDLMDADIKKPEETCRKMLLRCVIRVWRTCLCSVPEESWCSTGCPVCLFPGLFSEWTQSAPPPLPGRGAPELPQSSCILEELQDCVQNQHRTVIHCYGGLGRSGLIAACLLLQLSVSMMPRAALEILRELRGGGAIQTFKFREKFEGYQETKERLSERSVSG